MRMPSASVTAEPLPTERVHPVPDLVPPSRVILGVRVHAATYLTATRAILAWAEEGASSYLCATGAHGVVEAQDDADFRRILNEADLNVPDGMPLVWSLRHLGLAAAERCYGPDLTLHVCRAAADAGLPIALYGSSPETLELLQQRLPELAPGLSIACAISPPFRALSEEEDAAFTEQIIGSGARIVLVGLGCPKQERWCAEHKGRIPGVMLAVGAAFDFHAGRLAQAPPLLQRFGLEWAFRLMMEPRRLWKRYSRIVPRFLIGFARQMRHER